MSENAISFQALLDSMEGVAYVVDRAGLIQACGGINWTTFACNNGGWGIADAASVVGRPLLDFVTGIRVADAYRGYMARLFDGAEPHIRFPFRCDAPDLRREHWMTIRPIAADGAVQGLLFQSVTLGETLRPPLDLFDLNDVRARLAETQSWPIVTICSYCHDVTHSAAESAGWLTPEDYYRRGGSSEVRLSHGICPSCYGVHVIPYLEAEQADDGGAEWVAPPS